MSTRPDFDRSISAWLVGEAPDRAPKRLLLESRMRITATRQRWSWWPVRRIPEMTNAIKLVGAAAVLIAAIGIAGFYLLPNSDVGGAPPSQSPRPSPTSTATYLPMGGPLEPGRYYFLSRTNRITLTLPGGWISDTQGVAKHRDQAGEVGLGVVQPDPVTHVYADACHSAGTLREVGPSVEDLTAALMEQKGSTFSAPVDVTLGGYPAKRMVLTAPNARDTATCRIGGLQIWANESETSFLALAAGPPGSLTLYIVDINGDRQVIGSPQRTDASSEDVAELADIISSLRIEPS